MSIFVGIATGGFALGFVSGMTVSMILLVQQAFKRSINSSS